MFSTRANRKVHRSIHWVAVVLCAIGASVLRLTFSVWPGSIIDGNLVGGVDQYNPTLLIQEKLFSVTDLPRGQHEIRIEATYSKNKNSRGNWTIVDKHSGVRWPSTGAASLGETTGVRADVRLSADGRSADRNLR